MYKTTQQLIDDGTIKPQLAELVKKTCEFDNAPIIRNCELTDARCMRMDCRGHMKHRADDLLKYLGVKGIGPETCLTYIKTKDIINHFQIIPVIFGEVKPRLYLWEIAMFCYIPGIQKGWEDILAGYGTFAEYFESGNALDSLLVWRGRLETAEKFFNTKPPLSRNKIEVMITGSVNGYSNRDNFIVDCNSVVGGIVRIKPCGPKQKAHYLICEYKDNLLKSLESGAEGNRKTKAAWRGGAKIVTSAEFLTELHLLVKELLGINK